MKVRASSVDEALTEWLYRFRSMELVPGDTRNGPAIVMPDVCVTEFPPSFDRVSRCPVRDANPFFHFFESLWILAGRTDVEFIAQFNPRMREFSDDGKHLQGAYGGRLFPWLNQVATMLRADPEGRRSVINLWDNNKDLEACGSLDLPCNTMIHFMVKGGALDMYIMNRSNDLIWGLCGANAVHFSYVLEYVAGAAGYKVGKQVHISTNLHMYTELKGQNGKAMMENPPVPLVACQRSGPALCGIHDAGFFMSELHTWLDNMDKRPGTMFLSTVAYPAWNLWKAFKDGTACEEDTYAIADQVWAWAMGGWIKRRLATINVCECGNFKAGNHHTNIDARQCENCKGWMSGLRITRRAK